MCNSECVKKIRPWLVVVVVVVVATAAAVAVIPGLKNQINSLCDFSNKCVQTKATNVRETYGQ